jgi:tetratricopeptide (TPR) repeat protein
LDSATAFADRAISLAQKLNQQKELASAYNNKGINIINQVNNPAGAELIKKALVINKSIKDTNGIADNLLNLGILALAIGETDTAVMRFDESQILYKKKNNTEGLANIYFNKAYLLSTVKQDSECINLFNKAILLYAQTGNQPGLGITYDYTASYYCNTVRDYQKSLEWFNKALKADQENNLSYNLAQDYANLSNSYLLISNFPKALDCLLKSLRLSEKTGASLIEGFCLSQLGSLYLNSGEYTNALEYEKKGVEIQEKTNQQQSLSMSYTTLATIYSKLKNSEKAFEYFKKSKELALSRNDAAAQSNCYTWWGRADRENKQYDLAIQNFQKAMIIDAGIFGKTVVAEDLCDLAICIRHADAKMLTRAGINPAQKNTLAINYFLTAVTDAERNFKRDAFFELSNIYEEKAETTKAFAYFKQYVLIKDSIINSDNLNSIANLQIQYDSEKREHEIAFLTKDKALQLQEIEQQKSTRNSFTGGIALILLITGITYNRYRVKQKANAEITATLLKLKNTQQQIIEHEKLAALGKLTSETAQEIEVPLNYVNNLASLNNELSGKINMEQNDSVRNNMLDHLKINLQKINQYGKNADAVVKKVLVSARSVAK